MTAPEPTRPAAEHIDAVARRMSTREWGEWSSAYHADFNRWTWDGNGRTDMERAEFRDYADAILTSTDAAVHAAMLDALVRAGAWERAMDGHEPAAGMCLDVECFCGWPTREDFERGGDNWTPDYREHLLDILAHEVAP